MDTKILYGDKIVNETLKTVEIDLHGFRLGNILIELFLKLKKTR